MTEPDIVKGARVKYKTKERVFREWRGIVEIVEGNIAHIRWLHINEAYYCKYCAKERAECSCPQEDRFYVGPLKPEHITNLEPALEEESE